MPSTPVPAPPTVKPRLLALPWGKPQWVDAVARALRKAGYHTDSYPRGQAPMREQATGYIRQHRPRFLWTWQRPFGGPIKAVLQVAREHGVTPVYGDFGLWPHYATAIFDPAGENAASSLVGALDALEADPVERAAADGAASQLADMRAAIWGRAGEAETRLDELGLADLPPTFALLTLQRNDKVLDLDADAAYRAHAKVAQMVAQAFARAGAFVVIKPHPQGRELDMPARSDHHLVTAHFKAGKENDLQLAYLLTRCTHLVTVNSTTWSLAGAVGKPTTALGRGWYSGNGVVHEAADPDGCVQPPEFDAPRMERFLLHMLSRQLHKDLLSDPEAILPIWRRFFGPIVDADYRETLIIGCGRSGTVFTSKLCRALGRDVAHEDIGTHGGVGWGLAAEHSAYPGKNLSGNPMPTRHGYRWGQVLHQVREPLAAIGSLLTHTTAVFDFVEADLNLGQGGPSRLFRAARYWLRWNERCEALAEWTFRVEDLRQGTPAWAELCRRLGVAVPDAFPRVPRNTNARKADRVVAWSELDAWPDLRGRIQAAAARYGYPVSADQEAAA